MTVSKTFKRLLLACLFLCVYSLSYTQTAEDKAEVEAAAFDYVEGFYQGDTSRIHRSILPEVNKYGYYRPKDKTEYDGGPMSFKEMIAYVKRVKEKKRFPKPDAPKKVELLDVQDQTAAAKVTAWWGTDYLLLGKYDGKWMVVQILWQSPPPMAKG